MIAEGEPRQESFAELVEGLSGACAGTVATMSVDGHGCSLAQFCAGIHASTKIGARICRQSDWRNDEPITSPKDCAVMKQGGGLPSLCVWWRSRG